MKKAILFLIMFSVMGVAGAETIRYVVDDLTIPIRTGTSTRHKILRFVESGTRLEVLEVAEAEGYTRVRTPDGTEGWVKTEQLMDRRGAKEQLARTKKRLESARLQNSQHQEEIKALNANIEEAKQHAAGLEQEIETLKAELASLREVAAEPIKVSEENKTLKVQLANEREDVQRLLEENAGLRDRSIKEWFVIGAGVAVGGLILGLILPLIPWRKRRWDFH